MAWLLLSPSATFSQPAVTTGSRQADSVAQRPSSREEILQSSRWRRLVRSFDEWLSVQKIYSAKEVADLKAGLRMRVASMPVGELEDFIDDTEQRLAVLMSQEATDARSYLSLFTAQGRRQQVAPSGKTLNVFDMSAAQLRQELRQFQQGRAERGAAQTAFNRQQSELSRNLAQQQRTQRTQQEQAMRQSRSRQARQTVTSLE
jgi:septal ring factor EnvC (AmiA/AmiB activator)